MNQMALFPPSVRLPKDKQAGKPNGYARPPGTGPKGETCATCVHCVFVRGGTKAWPKCEIIRHRWTGGPGTDIKRRSPACEMWQAPML